MKDYIKNWRLYEYVAKKRKIQIIGLFLLMILGAIAEMATMGAAIPFMVVLSNPEKLNEYKIINIISEAINTEKKITTTLLFVTIVILAGIIRVILVWSTLKISNGMGSDLGNKIYETTLKMPYLWHVKKNTSEILTTVENVNSVVNGIITPILQASVSIVITLGMVLVLLMINSIVALLAGISFALLYFVTSYYLRKKINENSKSISIYSNSKIQAIQEGVGGIREIKLDQNEFIYTKKFKKYDEILRKNQILNIVYGTAPRYVIESFGIIIITIIAYYLLRSDNEIIDALPMLGALALGAQKIIPQMQIIYYSWTSIAGNKYQLEDVLQILDERNKYIQNNQKQLEKIDINEIQNNYLIELNKIVFKYDEKNIINNVSIKIKRGEKIGIIGSTGCGKSTLIDIIMGLLKPGSGELIINGSVLNELNIRSWQTFISHVPQNIYLTDATIAENIAFGVQKQNINIDKLNAIIKITKLEKYVGELKEGINTEVGERGIRLSGGQKQRIGLARALYKNTEVIILDEATSSLDNETESAIMEEIEKLYENKTIIMIAHRLTTLKKCNKIYVMNSGNIQSIKTYEEIIQNDKLL